MKPVFSDTGFQNGDRCQTESRAVTRFKSAQRNTWFFISSFVLVCILVVRLSYPDISIEDLLNAVGIILWISIVGLIEPFEHLVKSQKQHIRANVRVKHPLLNNITLILKASMLFALAASPILLAINSNAVPVAFYPKFLMVTGVWLLLCLVLFGSSIILFSFGVLLTARRFFGLQMSYLLWLIAGGAACLSVALGLKDFGQIEVLSYLLGLGSYYSKILERVAVFRLDNTFYWDSFWLILKKPLILWSTAVLFILAILHSKPREFSLQRLNAYSISSFASLISVSIYYCVNELDWLASLKQTYAGNWETHISIGVLSFLIVFWMLVNQESGQSSRFSHIGMLWMLSTSFFWMITGSVYIQMGQMNHSHLLFSTATAFVITFLVSIIMLRYRHPQSGRSRLPYIGIPFLLLLVVAVPVPVKHRFTTILLQAYWSLVDLSWGNNLWVYWSIAMCVLILVAMLLTPKQYIRKLPRKI